jgi:hypothetical protein
VTPLDSPALVNPMKIGIDEHEQNGVTVPSNAPIIFAPTPRNLPNIFFVLSGGKYDCIYEITKIKKQSSTPILMKSYMKNCIADSNVFCHVPASYVPPMDVISLPIKAFSHFIPNI